MSTRRRVAVNGVLIQCDCETSALCVWADVSGRRGPRDMTKRLLRAVSAMRFVVECESCGAVMTPGEAALPGHNIVGMEGMTVRPMERRAQHDRLTSAGSELERTAVVGKRGRGRPPLHGAPANTTKVVFRRQRNRRLWTAGGFATLDELLALPRRHVLVIDAVTGRDITSYMVAAAKHESQAARLRGWKKELGI